MGIVVYQCNSQQNGEEKRPKKDLTILRQLCGLGRGRFLSQGPHDAWKRLSIR